MGRRTKQDVQKCHLWSGNVYFQKHLISRVIRIIHDGNGYSTFIYPLEKTCINKEIQKKNHKNSLSYMLISP